MENLVSVNSTESDAVSLQNWEDIFPKASNAVFGLKVISATLSMFGIPGNILTMMVIAQWENLTSGAAFMFSLALTDLLTVVYDGVIDLLLPLFGFEMTSLNDVFCAVGNQFTWASTLSSYYVTVLFSLDKCLAVLFPFKYRNLGKPKVCVIGTTVVYVLMFLWSSAGLFVYRLSPVDNVCRFVKFDVISRNFFNNIRPTISLFINGIIPISTVGLFTTVTIVKLRLTANRRSEKQKSESVDRQNRRDMEVVRQMIVVCSIFVFSSLINAACVEAMMSNPRLTMEQEKNYNIYQGVMFVLQAVINSANFYMYVIFGQKFRTTLLELVQKKMKSLFKR